MHVIASQPTKQRGTLHKALSAQFQSHMLAVGDFKDYKLPPATAYISQNVRDISLTTACIFQPLRIDLKDHKLMNARQLQLIPARQQRTLH